jgi:hypothetical protein
MGMRATLMDWAHEQFGTSEIADRRWRARLVQIAARAARWPAGKVTEVFANDAQRQGAYGLLESEAVKHEQVGAAMFAATARGCRGQNLVFCAVDGTSLTLTDRGHDKDFGPIGTRSNGARGIKVINALMLSSQGVPLGIAAQQWWTRPQKRRKRHRDALSPKKKETGKWLEVMAQSRGAIAKHAPGTRIWFQLDREADAWPMLTEVGQEGHWFTVRASHNRRATGPGGKAGKLRSIVARQPIRKVYELTVNGSAKRAARTAKMEVRACSMCLSLRDKKSSKRFPLPINVVRVRERGTNPRGEKPIVWTLLTNHPLETVEDLIAVVQGYAMRWRVEELHKTWKSGACKVEETQLRSASAVIKWGTILMAVAVRIERIKQMSRQQPDRPASDEFSPLEIRAAALLYYSEVATKKDRRVTAPTMAEITLWIAKIGGYTSQTSSGGPPGSITLSRGLDRVRTAAKVLEVASL